MRYPLQYGFESSLLYRGNVTAHNVSRAFSDPSVAAKFYNIRGVQSNNGQILNKTPVGQSWARISPTFCADSDPDPIEDKKGPGDGTQPAWTTRLLGLPPSQIITIVGELTHTRMLDLTSVQTQIAQLIGLDAATMDFDIDVLGLMRLQQAFWSSTSSWMG